MPLRLRLAAARAVILLLCPFLWAPAAPASATPPPAASPSPSGDGAVDYDAIDAYVHGRMEATHTPGLSYAVVGPEGPLHQRSWGTDGRGDRVTAETPFLWGSVAKPVTATAVMTLVQDGRLSLEDRVVDHLPDFRFGGPGHASRITVRHLLSHTAGLPELPTAKVTDCVDADCPSALERLRALDDIGPLGPPGAEYAYASANYLVLTALVEAVTGRPYADYLRESVLAPAGMDGAITGQGTARRRHLSPGHQLLWGFPAAIADGVDDDGAGYGYLGGDLHDLAAFASFQLRAGTTAEGDAVLTPESVRLMREEGRLQPGGTGTGYGLGWRVGGLEAPLDDAIWHTGATPGYSAMLFLLPDQDLALVLQQNLYGLLQDDAIMQVGFGAARMLAGGSAPGGASASTYHVTVWGLTVLAVALTLAAGRSAWLLRRPPKPAAWPRRATVTVLWCVAGAAPCLAAVPLLGEAGLGQMMTWVPDVTIAASVAAVAGVLTALLRLLLAIRPLTRRAGRRRPPQPSGERPQRRIAPSPQPVSEP
ncbi:serine hydrolase domain-containing protein [Streptomyces hoynatensis]|uniref:Class A beta-lactamase-related serine hydrolase n=1 Tax=Streptomyces hoynatensis TaxID=1141874 RepID=A0A3A9YT51_9ACTN|nr:serine hydrolase domain-containing protein [Streptomyces hoynatensis]RKN38969.1 class A beta-lactamase-related serine hydrolase [Streptomyces hoynatensis]